MSGVCLYCRRALGCPLLFGKDGQFGAERLFTEKSTRQCGEFVEIVGVREKGVRERMYRNFGLGYLRTLHGLPELVMDRLRQGEEDELMYENVPDFQKLLWEGMTSVEREDVLRYQTDENGGIIVEVDSEGVEHKLARPEYHIKAYMCDPDGPIKADKAVTWVWNINQAVDHIIKTEAEQGLIIKVKKPSATVEAPEQPVESETNMPAGRTVRTVRTTGAAPAAAPAKPAAAPAAKPAAAPAAVPAAVPVGARRAQPKPVAAPAAVPARAPVRAAVPAAGGRVANPPPRRVATPPGAPGRAVAKPAGAPTAPAAVQRGGAAAEGSGLSQEQVEKAVFNVVNPMIEELVNLVKASQQTSIDCATILGDIAGQTGGTFQIPKIDAEGNLVVRGDGTQVMEAPQLWTHPSKIFAHVEGTGFNPENLTAVDYDEEAEGEAPVEEGEVPSEETPEGEA
jgi:hypothetical protein